MEISFRQAREEDAIFIAKHANQAGEGFPLHMWGRENKKSIDPFELLVAEVKRVDSVNSFTKSQIAEVNATQVGCLICQHIGETPHKIDEREPDMVRPLLELERYALSTYNVFVLSIESDYQGKGIGAAMLKRAEENIGEKGMSLIVSDGNIRAKRLYERVGYFAVRSVSMIKHDWDNPGSNWQLMIKPKNPASTSSPKR